MKRLLSLTLFVTCLSTTTPGVAGIVEDIQKLFQSGDAAGAYALGQQHLLALEGDPAFDYEYGVAAIDAGHYSQGVFALERVLLQTPNDHRTRLELARGYFLLEQFDRARKEFETVLASEPPQSVAENIQRFLNIIRIQEGRYKSTASLTLDLDRGWDSNVNSAPFSPNFESPVLGPGTLAAGSTQLGDYYTEANVGTSLTIPVSPGRYIGAAFDIHHRSNDQRDLFDTDAQTLTLSLTDNVDTLQTRFAFRAQNYELDHSTYRTLGSLSVDARQTLSADTQITGFLSLASQHYPGGDVRDSHLMNAGIGVIHALPLPGKPVAFATAYIGQETPRQNNTDADVVANRAIKGLSGGIQWTLGPSTSLTATLAWQNSRYAGESPIFLARREDDFGSAGVTLKHLLDDRWSLSAELSTSTNDSNFAINKYDRDVVNMNLRYEY
ncbi:MAG: tetratricopeptide repeat protein [Gammaproteobacteria bacterium]|nr:tetratricopeptide repeat protein [Gammaproteobacteria bacterium]MCP5138188.1 tetratricopeptide repeat protein [Gammaproteobacteria bacterium]